MTIKTYTLFAITVLTAAALCGCAAPADTAGEPSRERERATPAKEHKAEATRPDAGRYNEPDALIDPIDAAIERGIGYLASAVNGKDGSYGVTLTTGQGERYRGDVGVTALVVNAIARSPFAEREMSKEYFRKALRYLEEHIQENGSITNAGQGLENYRTSIAAMALAAVDAGKYADVIKKAQGFIKSQQFNEEDKLNPDHKYYGGIGYGGRFTRPDLSNTQWALEALRETGLDPGDETFKKAVVFLRRCQNLTDTNDYDQRHEKIIPINDGGARYAPYESKVVVNAPDDREMFLSYGSMTYAFLKSMIYAGIDRSDPRLRAAFRWVLRNYSLDRNPGFSTTLNKNADKQGLFYYYHTMSKALLLYGKHILETPNGKKHNWALELSQKLASLQGKDGSWVNPHEARWYEGNPSLVTAYSIMALNNCRREILRQREFLANTPGRIADLEKRISEIRKQIQNGSIEKVEGKRRLFELKETVDALKSALKNLKDTQVD